MSKILVTGGAGYIGSHAVRLLRQKKAKVVVIDNLGRGYKEVIEFLQDKYGKRGLSFYQADLGNKSEIAKILSIEKPDAILHFAALCLVNESIEKPQLYFRNNVIGSLNLLEVMVKSKVQNLVFSSTCAVYGQNQYLPIDEKHPVLPLNPYGESKLMVERMIKWFGVAFGLKYAILRYFNVAGCAEDGSIGDSKKPSQLLVQNAVRGALAISPFQLTCPKVDTPDGTPIRDYINVLDLIDAHWLALKHLKKGGASETFNLGTGKGNSVLEIVNQVQKITGVSFPIEKGETRKGEYPAVYANIKKAKKILCWQPKRSLEESVRSLVSWYRLHPTGWKY